MHQDRFWVSGGGKWILQKLHEDIVNKIINNISVRDDLDSKIKELIISYIFSLLRKRD